MENLFSTEALWSLIPLTLIEILLGIDNVIFVSIVLSRLDRSQVKAASLVWMVTGIAMRLIFLFGECWKKLQLIFWQVCRP
mgnify:CR=1 FL=1